MSWKGTPVPNSGDIEKVYLNTNLTTEEFLSIVENINYSTMDSEKSGYGVLAIVGDNDSVDCYSILKFTNGNYAVCIINLGETMNITQVYMQYNANDNSLTLVQNTPIIDFGMQYTLLTEQIATQFGQTMQNEKVSSLFSITPFEEVQEEVTLDSWAEDIADAIREKKSTTNKIPRLNFAQEIRSIETGGGELLEPTAVPISGQVDKVYFNFNVDISKMVEVIANLPYVEIPDVGTLYPIITNADMSDSLAFVKSSDTSYFLIRGSGQLLVSINIAVTEPEYEFKIIDNKDDSTFYKNDFTQPLEFGFENMIEALSANFPTYVNSNELLKEMISITPIQKVENVVVEGGTTKYAPLVYQLFCTNLDVESAPTTITSLLYLDTYPQLYSCDIQLNPSTGDISMLSSIEVASGTPQMAYRCYYEGSSSIESPSDIAYILISDLDMTNFTAKMYFFKLDDIETNSDGLYGEYIKIYVNISRQDESFNSGLFVTRTKKPTLGNSFCLVRAGGTITDGDGKGYMSLSYSTYNQFGIVEE